MDQYFNYDTPVSGKSFVGRKNDVNYMSNMIGAGESVALYGVPHDGRKSLVKQTLTFLQMSGKSVSVAEVDLLNARTNEDVLSYYIYAVMKLFAPSFEEASDMFSSYFDGLHLVLDEDAYMCNAPYVIFNAPADEEDCCRVLSLPYQIAQQRGQRVAIYFEHFQNANWADNSHVLLKAFESVVAEYNGRCSMIFTGDRMNAMKEIFEVKRYFWKDVVIFPMSEIAVADATEFVHRGFQNKGKVIERTIISDAVRLLRSNMWYINTLFAITDYVSMGYATQRSFSEAQSFLMALHRNRFVNQMADLTDFQVSLLKAVIDGETRLSSSGIVDKYKLNSSANVKRLKDALVKKEVLWFDEKDEPHIQDPLFEIWLRQEYFVK